MYIYNNLKIKDWVTINGVQYPLVWFQTHTTEENATLGVTQVADPTLPDPRFYTWVENPDGSLTVTPIPLDVVQKHQTGTVYNSYNASLKRRADALQARGKTYDAVQLLIKSKGL